MLRQLYYGDNLEILRTRIEKESVDLCYIDPPFNSKRNYFQIYSNISGEDRAQAPAFIDTWTWDTHAGEGYEDILRNSQGRFTKQTIELTKGLKNVLGHGSLLAYLVSMTLRIAEIHRVLKSTGSFYLHCDTACGHYLKLILDAVFCGNGGDFKNHITWKRTHAHNDPRRFGRNTDVIFFYTKSGQYIYNSVYEHYNEEYIDKFFKGKDERGVYQSVILTGMGKTKGESDAQWKGYRPSQSGRHWSIPKRIVNKLMGEEKAKTMSIIQRLDLLYENDYILFSKNGIPRCKQYLHEMEGTPVQELWADIKPLSSHEKERLNYPTQKPEALLERIIRASSREGDTVLDAYCGCGTTVAVAERLKRNWMGIDITYQSISLVLKRLEDSFGKSMVQEIKLDGIPRDMESAAALANKKDDRVRKEFEKWAVLTYSENRAAIHMKKGADKGIDGTAYFRLPNEDTGKIIFQVKSGKVNRSTIATLRGDMAREEAEMGILLTLEEPTKPMKEEAKAAGMFRHELMNRNYDRIQIVTVKEMLEEHKRLEMPLSLEVVKKAKAKSKAGQIELAGQDL